MSQIKSCISIQDKPILFQFELDWLLSLFDEIRPHKLLNWGRWTKPSLINSHMAKKSTQQSYSSEVGQSEISAHLMLCWCLMAQMSCVKFFNFSSLHNTSLERRYAPAYCWPAGNCQHCSGCGLELSDFVIALDEILSTRPVNVMVCSVDNCWQYPFQLGSITWIR